MNPRVLWHRFTDLVGGPAQRRVVLVLSLTLGLDGADKGTIAATADNLKTQFHISNTDIGILLSVVSLVSAAATIPFGVLTDRRNRTRLLSISVAFWAVAMVLSGAAQSFIWLVLAHLGLGVVAAVSSPAIASLTGDFFPVAQRARMYGFILAGELVGSGLGFVVSGNLATVLDWRAAFLWLVIPAAFASWLLHRLPEPKRGGQGRLVVPKRDTLAARAVKEAGYEPDPDLVIDQDPSRCSLWWAVKYVLRVRTNVVLIVASAFGYFYFSGVRTFAVLFMQKDFHVGKPAASTLLLVIGLGSVIGVLNGGRIADQLLRRGHPTARVLVAVTCVTFVPIVLAPALWTSQLWLSLALLLVGAALLGGANPPIDAARLDIIHPLLWGRAEAVRTVCRTLAEAIAPPLFGYLSDNAFGGGGEGLRDTFLVMLVALVLGVVALGRALRTYPQDVATATASIERTLEGDQEATRLRSNGKKPSALNAATPTAGKSAGDR